MIHSFQNCLGVGGETDTENELKSPPCCCCRSIRQTTVPSRVVPRLPPPPPVSAWSWGRVGKVLWPFSAVTGVRGFGSGAGGTKFDLQPGPSGLVRPAAGRSGRGSREEEEEEVGASRAVSNGKRRPCRCPGRCHPRGGGVARRQPVREAAPSPLTAAVRVSAAPGALGAGVNGRRVPEAPRACGQPPPGRELRRDRCGRRRRRRESRPGAGEREAPLLNLLFKPRLPPSGKAALSWRPLARRVATAR